MNKLSIFSDLKLSPELILAVLIIVCATILFALGRIDQNFFYLLITLAIGLIGGSFGQKWYLRKKGLLK